MLEICIDSFASACAAAIGGADRVELCANLPEGGTTPSAGMIRAVRSAFNGGLMVIIRPRGYDFLYSEDEAQVMLHDIRVARESGADFCGPSAGVAGFGSAMRKNTGASACGLTTGKLASVGALNR